MSSGTRVETISAIVFTVYNNMYTIRLNVYGKETTKYQRLTLYPCDPQNYVIKIRDNYLVITFFQLVPTLERFVS